MFEIAQINNKLQAMIKNFVGIKKWPFSNSSFFHVGPIGMWIMRQKETQLR